MSKYKSWISELNINVDYYSYFIKAWIAFNSWYKEIYKTGTDSVIIEKIKSENNAFSTQMKNLLSSYSIDTERFKTSVGELHNALLEAAITSQERHGVREQITFTSIALKNSNRKIEEKYRYNFYYLNRDKTTGYIDGKITFKNKELFVIEAHEYNLILFEGHSGFSALSDECRKHFIALYKLICPYTKKSILTDDKNNCLKIGIVNFINDEKLVIAGIIEILYLLRCSLMHGDVMPCEKAMNVYRFAYEVLSAVLKRLL